MKSCLSLEKTGGNDTEDEILQQTLGRDVNDISWVQLQWIKPPGETSRQRRKGKNELVDDPAVTSAQQRAQHGVQIKCWKEIKDALFTLKDTQRWKGSGERSSEWRTLVATHSARPSCYLSALDSHRETREDQWWRWRWRNQTSYVTSLPMKKARSSIWAFTGSGSMRPLDYPSACHPRHHSLSPCSQDVTLPPLGNVTPYWLVTPTSIHTRWCQLPLARQRQQQSTWPLYPNL